MGVSFSGVLSRPPASALVATKPTSADVFTTKGESATVSSVAVLAAGAVCAGRPGAIIQPTASKPNRRRNAARTTGSVGDFMGRLGKGEAPWARSTAGRGNAPDREFESGSTPPGD